MKSGSQQFIKVALSLIQQPQSQGGIKSSQYKIRKPPTKLNLFGKGITFIKQLNQDDMQSLKSIRQIDLSHNALVSIENIKVLNIESLNLSHNKLIEEEGLVKILVNEKNNQISKNLTKISLKGNPFIKKPLSPQLRRYLFAVENDLELYTREELQYLDLLVQRTVENLTLESLFKRVDVNWEFIKQYTVKMEEDEYERWVLIKPEEYFKLIRRQMEWKLQSQNPYLTVKKFVTSQIPLQLFNIHQNRQHSSLKPIATTLVLELRKRNELLIKTNKQLMNKIQNLIFNYLTQKKMIMEKQFQKGNLYKIQTIQTPLKNIKNQKYQIEFFDSINQKDYPEIATPIYINKALNQKIQTPIMELVSSKSQNRSITQSKTSPVKFFQPSNGNDKLKSPFQEIIRKEEYQEKLESFELKSQQNKQKYRFNPKQFYKESENYREKQMIIEKQKQKQKNKENIMILSTPPSAIGIKKPQNKTSKTLFSLSQSLLQKPVIPSDESLHFQLQQGIAESQIQKMFFSILTKINPIYHLLYSPISSLNQTEKTQLIENLLELLKEKMKYIEKLQRFKVLYENEKLKSEDLLNADKKSKEGRQIMVETNASLQKELKQTQNQLHKLSYQLQLKAQQNFLLRQQNEKLHFQMTRFNNIKLQRQQQEEIESKIVEIREQGLKRRCMNLILLRASKLCCFQQKMGEINVRKNKKALMNCFHEWKQETVLNKNSKKLNFYIQSVNFNLLALTLKSNINLRKQCEKKATLLTGAIKLFKFQSFNQKLSSYKLTNSNSKKAQIYYGQKIKRILFLILRQNRECQKVIKQNEIVLEFRQQHKQKLKKWIFNEWLIWQRSLAHKQIEIAVNHEGVMACNIIENLCNFYSHEKSFQSKSLALELYLIDIRKINSFHKMLHEMSLCLQAWKLKLFKINMFTKRTYFDNFLSGVRRIKNKRRIKQKDEQVLKKKMLFGEMKEQRLRRIFKMEKFRRILKEGISVERKCKLEDLKKQIVTEKLYKNTRCQCFFERLKAIYRQKNIMKNKRKQVSYITKRYQKLSNLEDKFTMKSFFIFMRSTLRLKHNLIQFFVRKNKLLMQRTFYQFRVSCLQQKSQFFEQKLKQLGPDIELIQQRQIQTNIEKISLAREIQLKNQQIQEYEKQVNELKMLLQAKEIKYEKLKDIYAESIEINSRGRDIYEDIEKSLALPHEEFDVNDTGYMKIQDSNAESLQGDSKKFMRTIRQQDSEKKTKVYNYTKYSPERDVKTTQRSKDFGIDLKRKQLQAKDKTRNNNHENQKMSDFYPSFRRF